MYAEQSSSSHPYATTTLSTGHLVILTCGTLGLQCVWALLLACGTPYLLSLGYSHSTTALVWIVGPLCGTFLQPCLGAWSDGYRSKWGKRKPFIFAGVIGALLSMMSLALLRVMANRIYFWGAASFVSPHTMTNIARCLAIIWLCILNVSLQPIQVGLRALIVDKCPSHQQSQGGAWSGRFTALGSIITYFLDRSIIKSYPARSFEVMCIFASVGLALAVAPSLLLVKERPPLHETRAPKMKEMIRNLWSTSALLTQAVRSICIVQFASWLGWFPFLYYCTSYVSSLTSPNSYASGIKAYFLFAIVTFYFSVVLPWFHPQVKTTTQNQQTAKSSSPAKGLRFNLKGLWLFSQVLFAACMLGMFLVTSSSIATALVAISGLSWSLSLWVPLAMMSVEIATLRDSLESSEESGCMPWHDGQTGVLMSIYNVAISAPQVLAACLCSIVFWIIGDAGEHGSLPWIMFLGGVASLASAVLIIRLRF